MSQKIRKKRLKTTAGASDLLKREESDIARHFKDCLTFVPDVPDILENNELPEGPKNAKVGDVIKRNNVNTRVNLKCKENKSRLNPLDLLKPSTSSKIALADSTNKMSTSPSLLSLPKSQKPFSSFKSNKSNVFNNITQSFTSSKILSLQSLKEVDTQKRLELSSWGLPPTILEKYQARGVSTMFSWQVECLANKRILEENRNLVYSAPTSAGKTLVAEFLVLKTILERRKKVIFILPFISVVREKMFYFQDLLSDSGVRVEGFMGGVAPAGGFSAVHLAIATIEKANSLVNRLMEDGNLLTLGAVVIDELHLLGDSNRGYLLELLLTKLRYMTLSQEDIDIQLIGMSATLPNLPLIAEWLDAELYKTDFRPIPLNEQCKIGTSIFDCKLNMVRQLAAAPDITNDTDNIIQLCIETINGGHGVLIFCPTKNWCEKLALQLANSFLYLGCNNTPHGLILRKNIDATAVQEVQAQLEHCPIGLDNVLKRTVAFGVAFHHAGLTMDERDIIEGGFRVGSLKVLIATSTLSSGVNLPARRVIVRSPLFNGRLIDKLTYQQMIGRAGRMGKDTAGESILICKPNERTTATNLMMSSLEPIVSCLEGSGPLIRALLEAIASQIVRTPKDLDFYSKCTFIYKCESNEVKEMVEEAVQFLVTNEFLLLKDVEGNEKRLMATCLGKACLAASIPPRDGLLLFEELQRARKCFVLDTELHVIYLVTPFNSGSQIGQIDWMIFLELWRTLSESERRVGQLVGVEERFLLTAMRGIVKPGKTLNVHRRFYTALALYDLVREIPLGVVCRKYNCCRGLLQSLQQSSSTFAGMVTNFCKELKWDCMELLFAQFQARLQFGVCRDLLDLLRLPSLNGLRARSLFKHGITNVAELAVANELDVEEALNKALPFESEKDFDGENEAEIAKRTKLRTVFITGKDGLTACEAAIMVIKEAQVLVKNELGVCDIQWSQMHKNVNRNPAHSPISCNNSISLRPPSILNDLSSSRNVVSAEVHAAKNTVQKIQHNEEPMEIGEAQNKNNNPEKIVENEKRLSSNSSASIRVSSGDVINESNEAQPLTSRLRSKLSERTKVHVTIDKTTENENNTSKSSEIISVSRNNVINESDKAPTSSRLLRSKLAEKTKNILKENEITICTMDFQDDMESLGAQANVKNDEEANENKEETIENKANSNSPESFQVSDRMLSELMKRVENEEKNVFTAPAPIISTKVAEEKKRESGSSNYSKSPSLFSDSSFLDPQICSILEKNVVEPNCFSDFERSSLTSQKKIEPNGEICRKSTESNNSVSNLDKAISSKENIPNKTGADSLRSQKNIIEKVDDIPLSINTQTTEKKVSDLKQAIGPMNWSADSWDRSNNIQLRNEKTEIADEKIDSQSPSLLKTSKVRSRLKAPPLPSSTRDFTELLETTAKKSRDKNLIETPKAFLRKHAFQKDDADRSPIASVRTYNTRRPFMPISISGSNKSDSEDSIVSSQTVEMRQTIASKTRSRIAQKLMYTQKLRKSTRNKDSAPKVTCGPPAKMLKHNSQPIFEDSASSDSDPESSESCLMFDSDNSVKSQAKKLKNNHKDTASIDKTKVLSSTNSLLFKNNVDKISLKAVEPINVANSKRTFRLFRGEIEGSEKIERRNEFAVSLVTEPCVQEPSGAIGNGIIGVEVKKKKDKKADSYIYKGRKLCGIVISWSISAIYYMPFGNSQDTKITIKERMNFLRDILTNPSISLRCFNAKEVYRMLYVCCEAESRSRFLDPNAGDWLLNSEIPRKSYTELAAQYFPKGLDIANNCDNHFGTNALKGITRAGAKALLAWYITGAVVTSIQEKSPLLLSDYKDVEMPTITILANMELRGFGVNISALQELSNAIKDDLTRVEEKAFGLAGRKFNFYSSKEVSQILGLTKKGRVCTNKNALKSCENPISNLVTLWRKLNTVQTKIVFPLLQVEKKHNRIHGNCITYTVTGRVSMHEPNLQTIPRDFKSEISGCVFSVRMAFVPLNGNVLLSADFCQLELRILAHFSQDPILCKLLHEQGDIFKNIAANLNKVTEEMVDDDMRQRAKQLCYAMIYGMGAKSLANTLSVTESEAKEYLEAFMGTYKGIRVWLKSVTEQARTDGFVSTIADRRRALPDINSKVLSIKAQAERQAVNTKVQGSAADIAKKAMVLIESQLREGFSYLPLTFPMSQSRRKLQSSDVDSKPRGGYLILQLHDELLYEVNSNDLQQVACIVKDSMEHAFALRVPLPVKVKVGTAWGNLEEYLV